MARNSGLGPSAQALTCRRGHYGWTEWEVIRRGAGWAVRAVCELGDHYLSTNRYESEAVVVSVEPETWPSRAAAEDALRRYVEQHAAE